MTFLLCNFVILSAQENILRLSDIIAADDSMFKPLIQQEIEGLEVELIAAFNALNEVEDFEITCLKETQNGSYFFRACDPAFLIRERQANNVAWRKGDEKLLTKKAIRLKFRAKLEQLDMAFSKMLNEDKNSMEIARTLNELRQALDRDSN
jgi:hypothetical protein